MPRAQHSTSLNYRSHDAVAITMHVLVIMGSKSDMPVADKTITTLEKLGISYEKTVASAHRTPEKVVELAGREDVDVFIAIAGLSAALPGAVAAHTLKPVIGVPVSGKVNLRGAHDH